MHTHSCSTVPSYSFILSAASQLPAYRLSLPSALSGFYAIRISSTCYMLKMFFSLASIGALALTFLPCLANASPSLTPEKRSTPLNTSASTNSSGQPCFTFDQLYNFQKKFLDSFISPADEVQAKAVNSSLLAEDVLGRIDITRTFKGRELNTEYLFGLFANLAATPGSLSLLGVPVSYEIMHLAANENVVSALTRYAATLEKSEVAD